MDIEPRMAEAYESLGVSEASGWPHISVYMQYLVVDILDESRIFAHYDEYVFVLVPNGDDWRVGLWDVRATDID